VLKVPHVAWWHQLAPEPARTFRLERAWSIALRTAHIIAFSVVLGGYFWGIEPVRLRPAFVLTILTGFGLAGLELYKSLHWLFLGKGLVVLVKLVLLAWLPFAGDAALPLLLAVVVMPGRDPDPGAHQVSLPAGRGTGRPSRSPVSRPASTATCPFTSTQAIPLGAR